MKSLFRKRARRIERRKLHARLVPQEQDIVVDIEPHVTDHAVIRYLEVVWGLDTTAIRNTILDKGRGAAIKQLRSVVLPLEEGIKIVVKNGAVISVVRTRGKERDIPNGRGTAHDQP